MSRFVRRYSLYCSKTKGIYGKYSQFVLFFKLNIQTAFYVIISVDFQVTNSSNLTHKTNYSMSIMCKSFFSFFFLPMLIIYSQGSLFECVGQHVMNYLKVRTSVGLPTQPQIILSWAVSSKRRNLTSLARRRLTALCSVLTYVQRAAQNVLSEKDSPVFKHILYTLPFTTRPFNSISSLR